MKKTAVTLEFEVKKMEALRYYLGKKSISLNTELTDTLQRLYEKHVPQNTREYIEDGMEKRGKPKAETTLTSPMIESE